LGAWKTGFIEADAVLRRAAWRLVPLILAMYIAAFLNRVNVSFAALTMNQDLGFSPEVYGWGTGIFFLGYLLFEVPSNLIMERVGARLWLSRIMVTWAIVSMAFAFVQGPVLSFCSAFFWVWRKRVSIPASSSISPIGFPRRRGRASLRSSAWEYRCPIFWARRCRDGFWASKATASRAGNGCISWKAFPPWRWASVRCGACPTIRARRISCQRGKGIVMARLAAEESRSAWLRRDVKDWRVWALIIPDFCIVFGIYALGFWMPQMVKAMGYTHRETSLIVMIPYIASLAILWGIGVSSDRTGKRRLHFCSPR
jgi:ACS family tartrate transporter-like MFS transporter